MSKPLAERIFDWDDYVEDHALEQATKPFEGGIMLAVAKLFAAWDVLEPSYVEGLDGRLVQAIKNLRETAEVVIE